MATTEVEVSIPALSDCEDQATEALVHVGEDELASIEPENEGVVFVITTAGRKSRKTIKSVHDSRSSKLLRTKSVSSVSPVKKNFSPVSSLHHEFSMTRSPKKSNSLPRRRNISATEREEQERIDRENRILLRKILEQHHGIRRSTSIPPPQPRRRQVIDSNKKSNRLDLGLKGKQTSNQINEQRRQQRVDYENLLLLQKIQNAKPSRVIEKSFNFTKR